MPQSQQVIRILTDDGAVRFAEVRALFRDQEGRITGADVLGPVGWVRDSIGSRLHIGGMTVPAARIVTPLRDLQPVSAASGSLSDHPATA